MASLLWAPADSFRKSAGEKPAACGDPGCLHLAKAVTCSHLQAKAISSGTEGRRQSWIPAEPPREDAAEQDLGLQRPQGVLSLRPEEPTRQRSNSSALRRDEGAAAVSRAWGTWPWAFLCRDLVFLLSSPSLPPHLLSLPPSVPPSFLFLPLFLPFFF